MNPSALYREGRAEIDRNGRVNGDESRILLVTADRAVKVRMVKSVRLLHE